MLLVIGGWPDGHHIRTARKAHRCDYDHGVGNGGRCKTIIQPGDRYVEGDANDGAGGYARDRYCLACAGDEARSSVPTN